MDDTVEELRKYVDIDGPTSMSEQGELICSLAGYTDYFSDEFGVALEKEIKLQLKNYKDFSRIVETEETFTRNCVELVWSR